MGEGLLNFYQNKINKNYKLAFFSTFIIGLLTHTYKFTNTLLTRDSLYNFYSDQNVLGSGRWFLSTACAFSSFYDLPWVNGLFSVILIALTAVIIVSVFKITNPVMTVLTGGLLVTFPGVTETFAYEYTADGYMLAMLLSALAVYFSRIGDNKIFHIIAAAVCVCLCCGIYQAYVSFALVLAICYFITQVLENKHSTKTLLLWVRNQAIIYIGGLAAYYIIWQICMKATGITASHYQGIDSAGQFSGMKNILIGLYIAVSNFLHFFFDSNPFKNGLSPHFLLSAIFAIFSVAVLTAALKKSNITKNKLHTFFIFLALSAIPFAVFIWLLLSINVWYGTRMEESLCILYIFTGVLFCKYIKPKFSNIAALLLTAVISVNFINANIYYYYLDKSYEKTYAEAVELSTRIHLIGNADTENIVVIGQNNYSKKPNIHPYIGGCKNLMSSDGYFALFMSNFTGFNLFDYDNDEMYSTTSSLEDKVKEAQTNSGFTDNAEIIQALEHSEEVLSMGCWPAADSVKLIGKTIVVKLSEPTPADESQQ